MKRNEKYWREGLPYLDGIEFKVMTDSNTGLRSVLAGQNDFVYRVSPQQAPVIKRAGNFAFITNPTLYVQMVYFNTSRPPLDNKLLRQALNWAIDREAYNKVVTAGMGETAGTILPKRHWGYDAQAAAAYGYDPERARKLMAEAGFGGGLQLHSNHYSDQLSQQRMEILGAQLGKIGITIRSTVGAVAQANQQWHDGVGDIHLSAWTGRADPSITYASLFAPEGYYNIGGVDHSPELTGAIRDSRSSTDIAMRKEAFARAQRLERELALCVPLAFESEVVVHNPKVKGYVSNLIGKPRFDGIRLESSG
jgi:peptide/nickel transport system permease protein/peptide/nickel transport system substrate-binding protein